VRRVAGSVTVLAAGPTAYDIVVGAIALLGLGLSAYSVRRQVRRETRTVKVTCRYSFPVGAVAAVAPDKMVTLEVLNDGHRPIEITGVGFELQDGRQPLVMPLEFSPGAASLPRKLDDGGTASFYFDVA
jgi:hypothetical protein